MVDKARAVMALIMVSLVAASLPSTFAASAPTGLVTVSFQTTDLLNLQSFALKIKQPSSATDPAYQVSQYLKTQLSAGTSNLLSTYSAGANTELQSALVNDLNLIIANGALYQTQRFSGVTLSADTLSLLAKNPTAGDLVILNRRLLEDAYPLDLAKMQMGSSVIQAVIATSRMPRDTFPYWVPGVPGGISNYPVCVNVMNFGAKADGTTDDSPALANAIAACTNGGAVYLPAGVYRLNSQVSFQAGKRWVLRGAGPTQTVILCYYGGSGSAAPFLFGADTTYANTSVTGGYTRGSTSLTVSTPSVCHVGDLVRFYQNDDSTYVVGNVQSIGPAGAHQNQMFRIIGVSGSTITLDSPIYFNDYKASMSPRLDSFTRPATGCGLENLGIRNSGSGDHVVYSYIAGMNWITNCNITNAIHSSIFCLDTYKSTFSGNQIWYHQSYDTTERHSFLIGDFCTDNLIENNICEVNNSFLIMQNGASGNVCSYNLSRYGIPNSSSYSGGCSDHGGNANFNLFEGNVTPWWSTDETWGNNRAATVFRNWVTRKGYWTLSGGYDPAAGPALYIDALNYYMTVVGNILGRPERSGDSSSWSIGERGGPDAQVANTLFAHMNYDFNSRSLQSSNNVSQTLPKSLYLSAKPGWFGSLQWPGIGPDVNTSSSITNSPVIPAQARALGISY